MYYKTQPGGTYGVGLGNSGAIAGVDLPFGGGGGYKTIQEQYRPGSTDRQRIPDPIRVFPQGEPGREGAIDVKFRQAMLGGPLLAQGMPPMGNAGALGGMMQMGGPMQQGVPQGPPQPNVFSFRPNMKYLDPEEGGLQFGGELNIPLGEKGRINATGTYYPETNSVSATGTVGQPKGSPGFGIDFFVNRRLSPNQNTNVPGLGQPNLNDAGAYARYSGRF